MNRVLDLPLSASRLPMWMACKYSMRGFLHWGYMLHNPEERGETCYRLKNGKAYPSGNSFLVYNGDDAPLYSVRGHMQRAGAEDAELLLQLMARDRALALSVIDRVARTFDDYESSAYELDAARRLLLESLDEL